jgi:hypothetical protein
MALLELLGRSRSAGACVPVDIPSDSRYSKHAYAFVCRAVITVVALAGGEMSGLIAHFLFAAKTGLTVSI